MISAADPIRTATIAGVSVRFYAPPSGREELPWHSVSDLLAAARVPNGARAQVLKRARSFPEGEFATTSDGTLIESHNMAIGLIGALVLSGAVKASFADEYAKAGEEVLKAMHADLPPAERFERLRTLARETLGVELELLQ